MWNFHPTKCGFVVTTALYFAAGLWRGAILLPSLTWRLESLLLAEELTSHVLAVTSPSAGPAHNAAQRKTLVEKLLAAITHPACCEDVDYQARQGPGGGGGVVVYFPAARADWVQHDWGVLLAWKPLTGLVIVNSLNGAKSLSLMTCSDGGTIPSRHGMAKQVPLNSTTSVAAGVCPGAFVFERLAHSHRPSSWGRGWV